MKWSIEKGVILEALNNVTKALSQRTTIPVLNGIVFDVSDKGIELLASDTELTIKVMIEEKNIKYLEGKGKIVIQSKYFVDMIRKMPADVIDFEIEDNLKIKISTPNNQYRLNCYNPMDYPNINMEKSSDAIIISANTLREIINQTSYALSTQEVRPLLTGINLKINGDILECIATDSYRLSKKNIKLANPVEKLINIVIPGRSITEVEKIISEDENVEIHVFTNKILFIYKNISIQSNLLSGSYPETSHFIPNDYAYMINLNLKDFYDAVDRAALLAQNKERNIIKMHIEDKDMIITSSSSELGIAEEKLKIDCNNKEKIEISFSSKYMMDALKVIKEDNILLLINTDDKPILIKPITDETLLELILPVKTY
ncbi:MAG: DNA polymerase III subunit beta [Bacilli bacterium]